MFQNKIRPLLIIAVAIFLGSGCTSSKQVETMQEQSVGKVPCRSNEIEIIERKVNETDGSGYWIALCNGRTYEYRRAGENQTNTTNADVVCEEMETQMPE